MAPELPTELWIIILRLATEVIAELNTNAVSFFEIPSPREVREDHDDVLPTRRALVHVSRAFNTIAIPFLYQSVNLTKGHAIELLVRTVDSSSNLGNLVRRMDLNISGGQWGDLQPADLSYLMNQLPNLQILVAVGSWRDDYIDVFLQSLPYFKNLRILGPLSGEIYPRSWDHVETASSLPQLRALCSPLGIQTSNLNPNLFPNLRGLTYFGNVPWNEFIGVHGYKITHLTLSFYHLNHVASQDPHLPNLRHVVTDIESSYGLSIFSPPGLIPLPTCTAFRQVKCIGCTNSGHISSDSMHNAFGYLGELFPQANCIRILEKRTVDGFLRHSPGRILRWHLELKERGIRLEREDGLLLVPDDMSL